MSIILINEEADLRDSYLVNCNLENSLLCGADFSGATLDGVRLSGANLRGAKGFGKIKAKWIEIGSLESPMRLEGNQLYNWLIHTAEGKVNFLE